MDDVDTNPIKYFSILREFQINGSFYAGIFHSTDTSDRVPVLFQVISIRKVVTSCNQVDYQNTHLPSIPALVHRYPLRLIQIFPLGPLLQVQNFSPDLYDDWIQLQFQHRSRDHIHQQNHLRNCKQIWMSNPRGSSTS